MTDERFKSLQNSCRRRFERFKAESEKTLTLLALVRRYPENVEYRTALVFQLKNEAKAQQDYDRCRRRLCALMGVVNESGKE